MTIPDLSGLKGPVAVLCGGPGGEREVSLDSGRNVHEALVRAGVPCGKIVVPVEDPEGFLENVTSGECGLAVMMLHGRFGEDGTAQAILDQKGIPYSGSDAASCRLAMNKTEAKKLMGQAGVPIARDVLISDAEAAVQTVREAGLAYPVFVKPNCGGSSVATARVDDESALPAAVALALSCDEAALVETMIEGREMTVGWLDGRILPIIEMRAADGFYDYQAKYVLNSTEYICPAPVDRELTRLISGYAEEVVRLVRARDIARVDLILSPSGPVFLELNSLPGFTSHSLVPMAAKAAGIAFEELCLRLVALAAARK